MDNQAKHIPEQWVVDDEPLPARGFVRIRNTDFDEVCRVHKTGLAKYYGRAMLPQDIQERIRLIAAAPEMLEALKGMLEWARRVKVRNPGMEVVTAMNAITKAEGQS